MAQGRTEQMTSVAIPVLNSDRPNRVARNVRERTIIRALVTMLVLSGILAGSLGLAVYLDPAINVSLAQVR